MEAIVKRCCGLDVHQATVVACTLVGGAEEKPRKTLRIFPTHTAGLRELSGWLKEHGCTHVGMESTGVYWKPVYAVLEGEFDLTVGNARNIRGVPGRKTDVKDAEWIADLLRHGLIAKSFVPDARLRELRDLLRYRRKLVQSRSSERNRLLKVLETANIKLATVVSDVFGVSGSAMVRALIEGRLDVEEMAKLGRGKLRNKRAELALALDGSPQQHHIFLLRMQLRRLEEVERDIAEIDALIESKLEPYSRQRELLVQIPGVDVVSSAEIIAEIGVDMSVFKSAAHLASWAGVCPGNNESAGKRKHGKTRKGNIYLTTALVRAAQAAAKKKRSYYKDKFHRLKARRGYRRAIVAIAHKILVAAYHLLSTGTPYRELGEHYLDAQDVNRTKRLLVLRLQRLGYDVELRPHAA